MSSDSSRGKLGKILSQRFLTQEDVDRIPTMGRRSGGPSITFMRERYHALARLIAIGHPLAEAARMLRMAYQTAWVVNQDPMFIEAVVEAQGKIEEKVFSDHARTLEVMESVKVMALNQLHGQLEDIEQGLAEPLAPKTLITIIADTSDRTGHGKVQTNLNVNTSVAGRLERAIKRSDAVRPSVIDVSPLPGRPFPGLVEPKEGRVSSALAPPRTQIRIPQPEQRMRRS